jgi:uncharacterized protein
MNRKKLIRKILWTISIIFILMNVVAFFHAYKFTHFADNEDLKTKKAEELSTFDKIKTLLFGVNNPRTINLAIPSQKFETLKLQSNKSIECWSIKTNHSKGTVIIFHGYGGNKSSMIDKSE